jgi:hypothetical protein
MPTKSSINARLARATVQRERIDGETITIGGTARTCTAAAIDQPFGMEEAGQSTREELTVTMRIDQFLADPSTFDPAADYSAHRPANQSTVTLRGRTWRVMDPRRGHDSFLFRLVEARPRS